MTIIIVWDISIEINKDYAISKVESHYFDYIRIYSAQQWMECSVGWVIFCFFEKTSGYNFLIYITVLIKSPKNNPVRNSMNPGLYNHGG